MGRARDCGAARAYAALSQEELAARTVFARSTIRRVELGLDVLTELEERAFAQAIQRATGMPTWFFSADFDGGCAATARHTTRARAVPSVLQRYRNRSSEPNTALPRGTEPASNPRGGTR